MERLDELWSLSEVLHADYKEKLEILGIVPGEEVPAEERQQKQYQVSKMIEVMNLTKEDRFKKFQALASKLIDLWTYHKTEAVKMLAFPEVFAVVDASNADEINQPSFLSISTKKKMEEEVTMLEAVKDDRLKNKYVEKKNKLVNLALKTHMELSEFDYDPQKQFEPKDFKTETKAIKKKIKLVKARALIRQDVVLRMEMIQHCVSENEDVDKIQGLIKGTRRHLDKFVVTHGSFIFEGQELSVYLDKLEADTDERRIQESIDSNTRIKASLRSHPKQGRKVRVPIE